MSHCGRKDVGISVEWPGALVWGQNAATVFSLFSTIEFPGIALVSQEILLKKLFPACSQWFIPNIWVNWRAALGLKLLVLADKHLIASYFPHNLSLLHKTETSLPIVWFIPGWQNNEFNRKHTLPRSSMALLFTFSTMAMLCSLVSSLGTLLWFPMQHLASVSALLFEISWNLKQNHSRTDFGKHTSHTGWPLVFLKRCLGGWDEMMLWAAQSPLSRCEVC